MPEGLLWRYARVYAQLAARMHKSFGEAIEALVKVFWAGVDQESYTPEELEALRERVAREVVRNYSISDPSQEPSEETVLKWLPVNEVVS